MTHPDIPTPEQCETILASQNLPETVINHSRMVCDVALRIGRDLKWLRDRGPNIALITAGALLHDIAKGQADHAATGGTILRGLGYGLVAEIVEAHNDIDFPEGSFVTEKEIVFIADKLVKGDQLVTVIYMYDHKIAAYSDDPLAVSDLKQRKKTALRIKTAIEQETGKNLEELAIAEN
ncbi:HD domain-containing protein [Maridesulfovibrio hydrothermalis]|uniref:Metal dependent phosphohydrolase n=1 Tax=Maridesulfovibrio hydrothermalis AM13 = DSM 14728 TaxID=1121451 RepID=L0RAM8_9BACT|nr:HD domain-containing protein [Maridesulfovibrio hydrothermalis]CCO23809.1 Metal dependent phosphohydrolase [Maridesulfovibrio hydrothermalis AM13 = DSM 14728]